MRNRLALVAALVVLPLASASSQTVTSNSPPDRGPQNVISVQPLTLALKAIDVDAYSAEYERGITQKFSVGIGGTYWDASHSDDSVSYSSAEVKVRYYPMGRALHGISVGVTGGFAKAETVTNTLGEETFGGPSIGGLVEYQLILRSFTIALGGGVKNVQVSDKEISRKHHLNAAYPTARLSFGFAF